MASNAQLAFGRGILGDIWVALFQNGKSAMWRRVDRGACVQIPMHDYKSV